MNIEIRYQSRTGHTKAIAEAMGKALKVTPKDIKTPVDKPTDILFIGGGLYAFQTEPTLIDFVNRLDPTKVKTVVVFATAGKFKFTLKRLMKLVKKKGIKLHPETFFIQVPSEAVVTPDRLKQAAAFAKTVS